MTTLEPEVLDVALGGAGAVFTGGAQGAWLWDSRSRRLYGDARFAALYGLSAEVAARGVPTLSFFQPIHPDDLIRIRIAVAGLMQGAEIFDKEFRLLSRDGEVRWVSARGRAEHHEGGRFSRFSGVLSDISDQKRVEERLRVAQTAGGVGTFEHLSGFGTATVSDQFCHLLGLHPAQVLPVKTINALVDGESRPLILAQGGTQPGPTESEHRIRRGDTGEERWLACRGEHLEDGPASALRFIGVVYDITEAKRTEAQLKNLANELERRVEARTRDRDRLWRISRDLMLVLDADGRYLALNPTWERVLGWSETDLVGRVAGPLTHPDDAHLFEQAMAALARGDVVEGAVWRVRAKDGAWRWIAWSAVREGGLVYATGRDISERRQLEEALRQSQKMEAVGQLTGGLAHDLNNMLTGVLGGMDLLRRRLRGGRTEDVERYIDMAATSAERAAGLTRRLLAFSRRQTLDTKSVEVGALVASLEDLLRRTLGEKVALEVCCDPPVRPARTDANQLESAILNLAINGRDAMPEGGRLSVTVGETAINAATAEELSVEPGEYVTVTVADTGTGIPAATLEKVFEPFFMTKPIGQGTGLGLSMVYGFMRQSGGSVSISSEVGQGTQVTLYLPLSREAPVESPAAPSSAATYRGEGQTVLLVEDDASVRQLVREVLDELGYRALEAENAPAALALLQAETRVDLLITDVGLPGLDGRQLAELARARSPDLPVLFMTGYAADAFSRSDFVRTGMDMIDKPFTIDAIAGKIRAMISPEPV